MKSFKSIFSIVLIIFMAIINYVSADNMNLKNEELIVQAFKNSNADFEQLNLNFKKKILEYYINDAKMKEIGYDIIRELNILDATYETNVEKNDLGKTNHVTIHGRNSTNDLVTIILYSFYDENNMKGETNLVIDYICEKNCKQFKEILSKTSEIFMKYDKKAEITSCIIGTFKGELDSSDRIKKITEILQIVNGNKVEGLFGDELISISAYSPNIDTFIYTGNKKMNLNIALSYNEYEEKTFIWIGIPIIAIGY